MTVWFARKGVHHGPILSSRARLVADVEAFLCGDYAEHLRRQGESVVGWAWLNRLAHDDLESLHKVCASVIEIGNWAEVEWIYAEQILVNELIELVGNDSQLLLHLQSAVLVPLEHQLIQAETRHGLTPVGLVQSTRAALRSSIP
jgi:hypothetical protein